MSITRLTGPTVAVLRLFVEQPRSSWYGLEIIGQTGLPSGTVHPILARLEGAGWLTSTWEAVDPAAVGRPRRRIYELTEAGLAEASRAVAKADATRARLVRIPAPVGSTP